MCFHKSQSKNRTTIVMFIVRNNTTARALFVTRNRTTYSKCANALRTLKAMLPAVGAPFHGRTTRSGHIFSPYDAEPYPVPAIDIYDFIQRQEEQCTTRELDESLVRLEDASAAYQLVAPIPIDLNLDLQLPPLEPPTCVAPKSIKRRATASAAATSRPPRSPPPSGTIRVPRISPAPPTTSPASISHPPGSPPPPSTIRVPRLATPAQKARKSRYHKALRLAKRLDQPTLPPHRKAVTKRRVQHATPIFPAIDVSDLHTTSTAWLGVRIPKPQPRGYSLQELREQHQMEYLAWDALAGPSSTSTTAYSPSSPAAPDPTKMDKTHTQPPLKQLPPSLRNTATVATGVSYGGGQTRPGNLLNSATNSAICAIMVANWAIIRITGFTNGMFLSFAPSLHSFYISQMRLLWLGTPYLRRLFLETVSVFVACTFNFGPSTVTLPHVDAANLAWGWCAITSLGHFNPDLGGHLILWDLNLIIRFPPGSTILIPSALLRHSNVSIQQGETRHSFTQYTAGGLFRWVYNGNRSDNQFYLNASPDELTRREMDRAQAQRWEDGLKMFTVWNPETAAFEQSIQS
ncbi:hypothetical protein B0H11DRAFT_2264648 [Mycena galericulata]|nr:hypothetical protein B0H11DRAFT_2264648 [Mycena galericulata]